MLSGGFNDACMHINTCNHAAASFPQVALTFYIVPCIQIGLLVPSEYVCTFDAAAAATQTELQQLQTFLTE